MSAEPATYTRPSALNMAEVCGLAADLARRYPETSDAAEEGTARHAANATALRTGTTPAEPGPARAVAWVRDFIGSLTEPFRLLIEDPVELLDPDDGDVLTAGTPDLVIVTPSCVTTVDFKGRRENVPPAHDNLQLAAYSLAVAMREGAPAFQNILIGAGDDEWSDAGPVVPESDWWPLFERIKRAASRKPEAHPGPWCGTCYQRFVCPSYAARARLALAVVNEPDGELVLTEELATRLALALKPAEDALEAAKARLKEYVLGGGRIEANGKVWVPVMTAGKRSGPSLAELEAQGRSDLIKPGTPYPQWRWVKA